MATAKKTQKVASEWGAVEMPLGKLTPAQTVYLERPVNGMGGCGSYVVSHVDVSLRGNRQHQAAMQKLVNALRESAAVLANGREVANAADAIRWLLEKYDAQT